MGTLLQDVRFALRSLRRAPAFPIAAIATLALGIGATTAIFTTLNAVLLKPMPYPNPEDLYSIRTIFTDGRVTTGLVAGSEIHRLHGHAPSLVRAAGMQGFNFTLLRDDGTPESATVHFVTEGFFELFGLPMTLGGFQHDHFAVPAGAGDGPPQNIAPPVVVISNRVWRERYGSDPAIVGKPIRFAEFQTTIAGVAPAGFETPRGADYWGANRVGPNDVNHGMEGFMRLKPGATLERAMGEMAPIMEAIGREFPAAARNRVYVTRPLVEQIVGDLGPIMIIVMSATGLLLLLACVNVTNLMLARGAARAREMAVRVSLGAGRGRIVRQLLTESLVLATAGALLGVLVAVLGVRGLLALGASRLPRLDAVTFDTSVLLFVLGILFVTGLLVGFAPALRLARTDVRSLMNESSRSTSGGRGTARWLGAMTVAEVALAIMLVAGAGWLVRGFANLRNVDAGFRSEQRLLFDVSFQGQRFPNNDAVRQATADFMTSLRNLQGVTGVGTVSNYPLKNTPENSLILQFDGQALDTVKPKGARQRFVSGGLFSAMGTNVVQGRDFGPEDAPGGQPVAIVNRMFVRQHLEGRDPIGVRFAAGYPAPNPNNMVQIVGVIDDVRQRDLGVEAEPAFYSPVSQFPLRRLTMVVSTSLADLAPLQSAIRDAARQMDPLMAINFEDASEVVAAALRRQQLGMTLMLIFGAVAVVLAAVGIYGVVAYAVSQRRDEMATRLALGATPVSVFWLVMKQGLTLAVVGTVIGVGLAYLSGRIVSNQVYAVRASDPVMLSLAIVLVVTIAVAATMLPAWRASRVSPARVLHPE